ncbi:hypothetical protein ACIA03_01890 [Nocardioides sp. NPDC051685]|uniref:hypothetical protein n=1 Tax=Nocardioides sp. NPDC051685 TaxID=3364334 RepID=UPI00379B399C
MLTFDEARGILFEFLQRNPPGISGTLYVAPDGFEDSTHYMPAYGAREYFVDGIEAHVRLDNTVSFVDKETGVITQKYRFDCLDKIRAMTPIHGSDTIGTIDPERYTVTPRTSPRSKVSTPPPPPPAPTPAPTPPADPMLEKARALVEELRRVPSWWGVSFRGFTRESQFGLGTRSTVARGLVPASRNLRMATENYTCAGAYAIVGPDGRAIESIAIKDEQEVVFLPGTFFQFVGDFEVAGFPIRLVNQTTINPADRAEVDWDNIRARVATLHEYETKKVKGNYRIHTPGKFIGDIH